jgi:hypothetical protein
MLFRGQDTSTGTAARLTDYGTATDYAVSPKAPSPALAAEAYVGGYANDLFGRIEVAEKDNGLLLLLGPKKDAFPLKHFDRDVFSYQPASGQLGDLPLPSSCTGSDLMSDRPRACISEAAVLLCTSPPWMVFLMNRKKAALIDMRVDLSRRDVCMSQQLLNDSEICSVRKQMGSKRVP